jgi:EAL and modified HD-GYP domain-containing signal transduction protein
MKDGDSHSVERYIARQPIFDQNMRVHAYELLYRGSSQSVNADFHDGDKATRSLLSDAITVFGLPRLTNSKLAFVNFTEKLLMSDFALMANPREVAVELLESIRISDELLEKLADLKKRGYRLALDDYTGNSYFDPMLPYIDFIKVDFRACDEDTQRRIAKQFRGRATLLAEKVETKETFDKACNMGYTLFQGYFFEKPMVMSKRASALTTSSYIRLFRELTAKDTDIIRCAHIVHSDATLTYHLFRKVRSMAYYRGNSIQSIIHAMVILGIDEIRRFCILLLARERNVTYSDELVRSAYLRACFTEALMSHSPWAHRSNDGFIMGMFSLLDRIMNMELEQVLRNVPIPKDISNALLGTENNIFSRFLEFILIYEMKSTSLILPTLDLNIDTNEISNLYMRCIVEADKAFQNN